MRRTPEAISTFLIWVFIRAEAAKNQFTARPAAMKGIPRPAEYAASRTTPWVTVSCCEA